MALIGGKNVTNMSATKSLDEWKALAKAGRLYVKQIDQREVVAYRKITSVSSFLDDGRLWVYTRTGPSWVAIDRLKIKKVS